MPNPKKKPKAAKTRRSAKPASALPLLVEIGTEELPPKALRRLEGAFALGVVQGLAEAGLLIGAEEDFVSFATPRRLAVRVDAVRARQPDRVNERRGPAVAAAFDAQGEPTRAAVGFAGSCGVPVAELERLETDKGAWLVHRSTENGRRAVELVPEIVGRALERLPIPKRMRWADLDAEFVRPVHWIVLLHGERVIDATLLSVRTGRETRGHRFHCPRALTLRRADDYEQVLETRGFVVPAFADRRKRIRSAVERAAARKGGRVAEDDALLDEVAALVEWPQVLLGAFDPGFLDVPPEALVTTMRDNQKYFHVTDERGRLLPYFVAVANIVSKQPARVREGYERVLRARFADARFFWDTDRKVPLERRAERLGDVVFHVKLGTLREKSQRVERLAARIATDLGADAVLAGRAARLAKADLVSGMVGEFPELQGIMGSYYARHDGEPAELAAAMREQYLPRFAGDKLPRTRTGQALAVAERLDTLVGIFGVGELPSGDKDPFALRRAALGALRILIERKLDLDLVQLLDVAVAGYGQVFEPGGTTEDVYAFMMERLRAYYADAGIGPDVLEAVLACRPARPLDFDRRVRGVTAFRRLPEAGSLAAANKRIRNILRQAGGFEAVAAAGAREPAEQALADALAGMEHRVAPALDAGDYTAALRDMAALREPVDAFFDQIMVMVDDERLRAARLTLLDRLSGLFLRVADISRLQ
jgi:glycyl-tRNA synthetase beta chain